MREKLFFLSFFLSVVFFLFFWECSVVTSSHGEKSAQCFNQGGSSQITIELH